MTPLGNYRGGVVLFSQLLVLTIVLSCNSGVLANPLVQKPVDGHSRQHSDQTGRGALSRSSLSTEQGHQKAAASLLARKPLDEISSPSSTSHQSHPFVTDPSVQLDRQLAIRNQSSLNTSDGHARRFVNSNTHNVNIDLAKQHQSSASSFNQDKLTEGSGMGPAKNQRQKYDDTEDSEDDQDDEDYEDYKDTLDSGSGQSKGPRLPHQNSVTQNNSQLKKPNEDDLYNPFRQPVVVAQRESPAPTVGPNTQTPTQATIPSTTSATTIGSKIKPTIAPAFAASTTAPATTLTFMTPTPPLLPPPNLGGKAKQNESRGEADYDYEEEIEDDDSEETSAFEDNDTNESDQRASNNRTTSAAPTIAQNKEIMTNITKAPSIMTEQPLAAAKNVTLSPGRTNPGLIFQNGTQDVAQKQTTGAKPTMQPATSGQVPQNMPGQGAGEGDDEEEDEEEEEEVEEEEQDGEEEEEEDEDGGKVLGQELTLQTDNNHIHHHQQHNQNHYPNQTTGPSNLRPNLQANEQATNMAPIPTQPTYAPSAPSRHPLAHDRPPAGVRLPGMATTTPYAIESYSTTPVPIFKRPALVAGSGQPTPAPSTRPSLPAIMREQPPSGPAQTMTNPQLAGPPGGSQASAPNGIGLSRAPTKLNAGGPAREPAIPINPSLAPTLTPVAAVIPLDSYTTTPRMQFGPSIGPTTHLLPYDREIGLMNEDGLTRQIYDRTVEVYQETERTLRKIWAAVWPLSLNLESPSFDPLLAQPMFFMCKCISIRGSAAQILFGFSQN